MPFEVPESWEWCRLGEVISVKSGKNIKVGKLDFLEKYPVYGGNGINGSYHQFNVEAKTLIIGRVGFYCGSIHKTFKKSWITDNALIVSLNYENIFELDFLYYLLINLNLGKTSNSTAQPVISGKGILPQLVAIPPLKEQKRIISQIERLFHLIEIIEESNSSIEQTVSQTKSKVLELAIKGKLVPQDPENEPASTLLEQLEIKKASSDKSHYPFEVPEGWIACQLYEICDFERGVTFPSSAKQTLKRENTIACVRTANVQEQLELDDLWYIDKSFLKNNRKKLLRKNDIIISTANSKELVGKTSFVENINEEMCFGGFVMVIRTNFINNKFLFYYLRDCFYNGIFSKKASQTTNIANINTTILGNLVIKVPPPAEQQRIVNKIEEIFKILDIMQENLQTNV